jgi:putative phage-type endonuclease
MNRIDWLERKNHGISGTDAAAILGQNPYMTNEKVWEYKVGISTPPEISEKPYVKYGNMAEKHLIELFKLDFLEFRVIHKNYDLRVNYDYDFLIGSIDGELTEKSTGKKGILEIKTTNILQSMHSEKWNNQIPQNYYIQILHYLLVTGFEFAILKAQLKYTNDKTIQLKTIHKRFDIEEVMADIEYLKEKEIYFWNENVLKRKKPALILPEI